jgi:hypothetical protein
MATSPLHVTEVVQVFREVAHDDPFMRASADQIRSDLTEWMISSGVEPTSEAVGGAICALTYLPQRLRQTDRTIEAVLPNAVTALADMHQEDAQYTDDLPAQRAEPVERERMKQ